MSVILPPSITRNLRPLAAQPIEALLAELQHRQLIVELKGEIRLPETPVEPTPEERAALIQQQFAQMALQVGTAIVQNPFVFSGSYTIPDVLDPAKTTETLIMAICLVKHPWVTQREAAASVVPA